MNMPKRIDITPEQLEAILQRVKSLMPEADYEVIKGLAETITFLSHTVDNKNTSVKRLLQLLSGAASEKTSKVATRGNSKKHGA